MAKCVVSTYMDLPQAQFAETLGKGNASKGVREALRRAKLTAHLFDAASQYTGPGSEPETRASPAGGGDFD